MDADAGRSGREKMMDKLISKIARQLAKKMEQQFVDVSIYKVGGLNTTYSNSNGIAATTLSLGDIVNAKKMIEQARIPPVPEIIPVPHMVERVLTKHPRKKKNRRWDKKYWKKYSIERPMESALLDNINKKLYCHPAMLPTLKEYWERQH
jgi:hypothetical protein